ncbi:protein-export chaperone SecB [Streptomyces sp. NPDC048639]|uniref:protein-export chaperone SecB n=1 Tax=Streptomyces sp. NPDC048639 TaxID=3365581 RepID=UPI00371BD803
MQTSDEFAQSLRLASTLHRSAKLRGIRLNDLEAKVFNRRLDPPYDVSTELEPSISVAEREVTFQVAYEVTAEAEGEEIFKIKCEFQAGYSHELESVSDEMVSTFGNVIVLATLHPYARELVHRVSSDLGFPGLFLDSFDTKDLFLLLSEERIQKPPLDENYN